MRNRFLVLLFLGISTQMLSQKGFLKGNIKDGASGETLLDANVLFKEGIGVKSDLDGNYRIELDYGTYKVKFSYVGYQAIEKSVVIKNAEQVLNIELTENVLNEVKVTADIAKSRETPVAFSNISIQRIKEDIGSRDIPMLLNNTPGVYATTRGGGEGDARVSIRGFNQRFIAVLIDGVPVNDMENGEVYWSNWFGLDGVTRNIQVQRGLGASKLAIPSVGGTMNIMTKGIDQKSEISLKQEITGDDMMRKYDRVSFNSLRTSLNFNSGRLNHGWGVTAAASYKQGDGYVFGNNFRGVFYYLKVEKQWKKQTLSVSVFGAPQQHGTRNGKQLISTYDRDYAAKLFKGSDKQYQSMIALNQAMTYMRQSPGATSKAFYDSVYSSVSDQIDSTNFDQFYDANFIDTTGAQNFGIRYNDVWGPVSRYESEEDTTQGRVKSQILNVTRNVYQKPQITIRHTWSPNEKFFLVTTLYSSIGIGGGNSSEGVPFVRDLATGNIVPQLSYDANVNRLSGVAKTIIKQSVNSHYWVGGLSTFEYKPYNFLTFSGGLDARYYQGIHYREVVDLFGGDYYREVSTANLNRDIKDSLVVGDKLGYNYLGIVNYVGAFGLLEYKQKDFSTFVNVSSGVTVYNKTDYFTRKDLFIDGKRYERAVGFGDVFYYNGSESIIAYSNETVRINGDTTFVKNPLQAEEKMIIGANRTYTNESAEAKTFKLGNTSVPSFIIKAGFNYNFNEHHNLFMNIGFISKAPPFNAVIPNSSVPKVSDFKNEKIFALELGYGLKSKYINANFNAYMTDWKNKPTTKSLTDPLNPDINEVVYIPGLSARHIGAELEITIKAHKKLSIEPIISYGDWRWTNSSDFVYTFESGGADTFSFDATNVHVGDAAQFQVGGAVRYEPIKGLYFKPQVVYFDKNFADFNPDGLSGVNARRESWRLPGYYTLDFSMGYSKVFKKKYGLTFRINLFNITNSLYIADAFNNASSQYRDFDAKSATVYFGQGFRWSAGIELSLQDFIGNKKKDIPQQ